MTMQIAALFSEFGQQIGIPALALDDFNSCRLSFDQVNVMFELDEVGERLLIYAPLGEIPPETDKAVFQSLLEANFLFSQTGGATLGFNADSRIAALSYLLPLAGLNVLRLEAELKGFVDLAEAWMQRLADARPDSPSGSVMGSDAGDPRFSGIRV